MESETQRKDKDRQEGEITEEPKRFMLQEMARGFSLFEETLSVSETQDPNTEHLHEGSIGPSECNPVLPCHL